MRFTYLSDGRAANQEIEIAMTNPEKKIGEIPHKPTLQPDIWRDTPLRYLGYANEVGEAFGPLYPKFVHPSYGIAFAYVGCDAADKYSKSVENGDSSSKTIQITCDALVWQTLASVILPGQVIRLVTAGATAVTKTNAAAFLPKSARLYLPTAVGLATIPFIIHPIDNMVDKFMDETFRKYAFKD